MIRERARVLDPFAGGAWVRTEAESGCARCASGKGCGSATLGRLLGDRLARVEVASDLPLDPGAVVEIGIDERALTRAALVVYGIPLLALLTGAVIGAWSGGAGARADVVAGVGGLAGLLGGLTVARRIARAFVTDAFRPRVLRELGADQRCGR